jgi:hypothetical protein
MAWTINRQRCEVGWHFMGLSWLTIISPGNADQNGNRRPVIEHAAPISSTSISSDRRARDLEDNFSLQFSVLVN